MIKTEKIIKIIRLVVVNSEVGSFEKLLFPPFRNVLQLYVVLDSDFQIQ